jgi:predicted DNA repair protein MutK
MPSSLLALLDDITSVLDDVALLTKVAAKKTSGVMGDDLALNAEQVAGVNVERELPVVWAVMKGSFLNKVILVPVALLISAFAPWAVMPLMMIGGLFLCYEGVEKLLHKYMHRHEKHVPQVPEVQAAALSDAERRAIEKDKIKGAVRTDFVLSAEIVVITLGTMSTAPIGQQVLALSLVSLAATVLVYGLVAGIVKIDDLGLHLHRRESGSARAMGTFLLRTAPWLMKSLSVLGTAAMFTVGGAILVHGWHAVDAVIESMAHATGPLAPVTKAVLDALFGVAAGALALGVQLLVQRVRKPASER